MIRVGHREDSWAWKHLQSAVLNKHLPNSFQVLGTAPGAVWGSSTRQKYFCFPGTYRPLEKDHMHEHVVSTQGCHKPTCAWNDLALVSAPPLSLSEAICSVLHPLFSGVATMEATSIGSGDNQDFPSSIFIARESRLPREHALPQSCQLLLSFRVRSNHPDSMVETHGRPKRARSEC